MEYRIPISRKRSDFGVVGAKAWKLLPLVPFERGWPFDQGLVEDRWQ
jgi:hypothetical protein